MNKLELLVDGKVIYTDTSGKDPIILLNHIAVRFETEDDSFTARLVDVYGRIFEDGNFFTV